jgi:hypothetical protein
MEWHKTLAHLVSADFYAGSSDYRLRFATDSHCKDLTGDLVYVGKGLNDVALERDSSRQVLTCTTQGSTASRPVSWFRRARGTSR